MTGPELALGNRKAKTIVLGLGNPILTDDAVGIRVARKIGEDTRGVEVVETSGDGFALLDHMMGFDRFILVDSIKTGQGKPGEVYKFDLEDLGLSHDVSSAHCVNINHAFEIGRGLGCAMPGRVSIYAVEIKDNLTFSEHCTEEIEKVIPDIARRIIEEEEL